MAYFLEILSHKKIHNHVSHDFQYHSTFFFFFSDPTFDFADTKALNLTGAYSFRACILLTSRARPAPIFNLHSFNADDCNEVKVVDERNPTIRTHTRDGHYSPTVSWLGRNRSEFSSLIHYILDQNTMQTRPIFFHCMDQYFNLTFESHI